MPTESNQPKRHGVFSDAPPTPEKAPASPPSQQTSQPRDIFGVPSSAKNAAPHSQPSTSGPSDHRVFETPRPQQPVSPPLRPQGAGNPPPRPIQAYRWTAQHGRMALGAAASLALIIPLVFVLRSTGLTQTTTNPNNANRGNNTALQPEEPPRPIPISPQAKEQMLQIGALLKTNYAWLEDRYSQSPTNKEPSPDDISNQITPRLKLADGDCPQEFKVAFCEYQTKWDNLADGEKALADFYRNDGSGLSKFWAGLETAASVYTKGGETPSGHITATENNLLDDIRKLHTEVNARKGEIIDIAVRYGVELR